MSDPYIGEIRMFAGNFAPVGWLFCQGQLLSIAQNEALFSLIGTTYGGDGQNTFALPNLASRLPVHQGTGFVLGQTGGVENVTVTSNQMPAHTHAAQASDGAATATSPSGHVWAQWGDAPYAVPGSTTPMSPAAVGAAGGNQPHDNMPPLLVINFIIALNGIYPSPS